jgi:TctA family transporter
MQLTGEQIFWVVLAPIVLGTVLNITVIVVLKRDILELVRSDNAGLIIRVLTITVVACWVGALTLANKVPESAATAIFGSILGYVFGVGGRPSSPRTQPAREQEAAPKELDK